MKEKVKILLSFFVCWVVSFLLIYLFIFFGGHKLFESDDVIKIEIGVSFILAISLSLSMLVFKVNRDKINELEQRIKELEDKIE